MTKRALILLSSVLAVACGDAHAGQSPDRNAAPAAEASTQEAAGGVVALENAFERAAATVAPSVVSITSKRTVRSPAAFPEFGGPFGELFGGWPAPPPSEQVGLGSGVILDERGHILTNNHVVEGAESLQVVLHDERKLAAKVVGTDPRSDLAVIKVEADGLVPARLGDSKSLRVGQWVIAYGNPFGLSNTVSSGIVSAVGRGSAGITEYGDFIQTDAAINPGNSGGPLIDLQGRVVGINTAIASRSGGSNGIGFAIPIHVAKPIADQLMQQGEVLRGWLGLMIGELDEPLARSFGFDGKGILVQDVVPDGPASKAGLKPGDIVVEIDGRAVDDLDAFRNYVAAAGPKATIAMKLWRDGKMRTLNVELGRLPSSDDGDRSPGEQGSAPQGLGLHLQDLTPEFSARLGLQQSEGVLVTRVEPGSPGAEAGLRPGDVLLEVGDREVDSARAAQEALADAPKDRPLRLRVQRGPHAQYLVVPR